jgi:hypothetical protein
MDVILERASRRFSATVRGELVQLREALAEGRRRGCSFHLVELEPDEPSPLTRRREKPDARVVATKGPGDLAPKRSANKRLQPTAARRRGKSRKAGRRG